MRVLIMLSMAIAIAIACILFLKLGEYIVEKICKYILKKL